jgi:hypothetical protein
MSVACTPPIDLTCYSYLVTIAADAIERYRQWRSSLAQSLFMTLFAWGDDGHTRYIASIDFYGAGPTAAFTFHICLPLEIARLAIQTVALSYGQAIAEIGITGQQTIKADACHRMRLELEARWWAEARSGGAAAAVEKDAPPAPATRKSRARIGPLGH